MQNNKHNAVKFTYRIKVLVLSALIVTLLFLFVLGMCVFPKNKGIKPFYSTFLPANYAVRIHSITLSAGGNTITLEKSSDGKNTYSWLGYSGEKENTFSFLSDEKTIQNFLDVLTRERNFYRISSSPAAWNGLGLTEQQSIHVTVRAADSNILADIYFGEESLNGRRIAFRTGRDISSFQTENDIYPYLKTETKWWADMKLLPVPLQLQDIQRVSVNIYEAGIHTILRRTAAGWQNEKTKEPVSEEAADNYISTLISGRGTELRSAGQELPLSAVITLGLGNGSTHSLSLFNISSANEQAWLAVFDNNTYGLVLSSWTYSRIISDFIQHP